MGWANFVAIGDSFTEGLDDHTPTGVFRGWADLVAGRLARERADFGYANLAIRGRLFDNIVTEQVPAALAMKPELVSFAAGGNDVLRRHFAAQALMARFDETIGQVRATGADVVLFRFADVMSRLPGQRMVAPRVAILNHAVGEVAERRGAHLVDLWQDEEFNNPALWSEDRLHMSYAGHRRVAAHVLAKLGVAPDEGWFDVPPHPARRSWPAARAADARWAARHLGPWVKRRLTGRSSGDTITAKRPALAPME